MGKGCKILLAFCLLACACLAQHRRLLIAPLPASGPQGIIFPDRIAFRWIATNLYDPVTNWTDIIAANTMTNSGNFPRTNLNAVSFDGTEWLYVTNIVIDANMIYAFILAPTNNSTWGGIVAGNGYSIAFGTHNNHWWDQNAGDVGLFVDGMTYEVLYAANNVTNPIPHPYLFTNGVSTGVWPGLDGTTVRAVGQSTAGDYMGSIYEIIIWTNAGCFTTNDLAKFHKYATNTYGIKL